MIKSTHDWLLIRLPMTDAIEDAWSNFLFELGATGCQIEDGYLEAYFSEAEWSEEKWQRVQRYREALAALGLPLPAGQIQLQKLPNRDWNEQWKRSIRPIEVGQRIIIKPSWTELPVMSDRIVIEIDPQMAFGTGTHATTQLMLELLEAQGTAYRHVLDIGTGTGILAIVAARLTPAEIVAFDNDPIATATARENLAKNRVASRVHLFCGTLEAIRKRQFDLILANVNRTVILSSLKTIHDLLSTSGHAILSGILCDERPQLMAALQQQGNWAMVIEKEQDEWMAVVIKKIS
ncbi:MAG: 50S ribosomal protein L11 methyltransferase [candidate division KSB1 bacterium]|nr:50S ribosomal protein L11 methyltransferase [candidate division KSB1 bacterium]MDZ7340431.1 50S ribosomal protein L11 methyltransferase [candidate division KSB1 bacterium]